MFFSLFLISRLVLVFHCKQEKTHDNLSFFVLGTWCGKIVNEIIATLVIFLSGSPHQRMLRINQVSCLNEQTLYIIVLDGTQMA